MFVWLNCVGDSLFLLCTISSVADRVLLALELAKVRRWCYGTSSVTSPIVVAHAAGRFTWPVGLYRTVEAMH